MIVVALALFLGSGYYWYQNVFTDPNRVLSDMLDKSLQVNSVYRNSAQVDEQSGAQQSVKSYLSFTPQTLSQSVTTINQDGPNGDIRVTTETVGTKSADYVRYSSIDMPNANKDSFKDVVNVWAKRDSTSQEAVFMNADLFNVYTIIPFANMKNADRNTIKDEIKRSNLYKINSSEIKYENGRPVMNYSMSVAPGALVGVLAKYAQITGLGNAAELNAEQYADAEPIPFKMTVDLISRHVTTVTAETFGRTDKYSGYNAQHSVSLPETTIGIDELQTRVSKFEQAQTTGN